MGAENVGHCGRTSNHSQGPFVEVTKRGKLLLALSLSQYRFCGVYPPLHRHLGESGQRLTFLIHCCRKISYDVDIRIAWNRQVGFYFDSSSSVDLGFGTASQDFAKWRRHDTARPDHCLRGDGFGSHGGFDYQAMLIYLLHHRSRSEPGHQAWQANGLPFQTGLLETVHEYPRRTIQQDDLRLSRVNRSEIVLQGLARDFGDGTGKFHARRPCSDNQRM